MTTTAPAPTERSTRPIKVGLWLSAAEKDALRAAAEQMGVPMNVAVTMLVEQHLEGATTAA